jgi:hypothetical protein
VTTSRERRWQRFDIHARRGRLTMLAATTVVIVSAYWFVGVGPPWMDATRWFVAGFTAACLLCNLFVFREQRVSKAAEDAAMKEMAAELSNVVKATLKQQGIEADVKIVPYEGIHIMPPKRLH